MADAGSPSMLDEADDLAAELDRPAGTATRLAALAAGVAVVALFGLFVTGVAGITAEVPTPCELHEAREGSPFAKMTGMPVESFRPSSFHRVAERSIESSSQRPGTIVRISWCAPGGADLVVYVAREPGSAATNTGS